MDGPSDEGATAADCSSHTSGMQTGLSGLAAASPFALVTTDGAGTVTFWNPAAEAMFGRDRADVVGGTLEMIMPERFRAQHAAGMRRMTATGQSRLAGKSVEAVGLAGDGREFPIELSLSSWQGPSGREYGAYIRDITERRKREMRLEHLATRDPVTGLLNRHGFACRIDEMLGAVSDGALVRVEVKGLSDLADTLDHDAFDMVLQTVALKLRAAAAADDVLGRVADDGFALLLCRGGLDMAQACADRLVVTFAEPIRAGCSSFTLPVAVGIALAPLHAFELDTLMTCADLAMLCARADAVGACRTYEPSMANDAATRRAFRGEILRATREHQWELWYQPQMDLRNGTVIGAEALLRWRHPTRGVLTPAAFLSTLETHAVAQDVGQWVIDEACRQLVEWRRVGHSIGPMAINLFAVQFRSPSLVADVTQAIERHGLRPGDLEIEIPETVAISTDGSSLERLRALRRLGIGVALDDFGTGFAALQTLKQFPVSRLKIDKAFVQDIGTDRMSRAIVGAILSIGRDLGIDVIAEGIETTAQSQTLLEMGCKAVQGYLYGRPVPPGELFPPGSTNAASDARTDLAEAVDPA